MNAKKIALIGVIALVVIGCVLAAGCTSNQSATPAPSTEKIVGVWTAPYDNGNGMTGKTVEVFNADGTGYTTIYVDTGLTHLLKSVTFTWKKNDDGTYSRTSEKLTQTVTYNAEKDTCTDSTYPSAVKTRMDPITGIWAGTGKDTSGKQGTITHVLLNDGTGYYFVSYGDGTVTTGTTTWTKNGDGTYLLKFSGFPEASWTLNVAGDASTTSVGNNFKKGFTATYYYLSYLGKWTGTNSDNTMILCGDGTGLRVNSTTGDIATFTWTIPEFGKLTCHYLSGTSSSTGTPMAGTERTFTYDRANDILVSDDAKGYQYAHEHLLA